MAGPNEAAVEWERKMVGQERAYITGGTDCAGCGKLYSSACGGFWLMGRG